jgi:hypothetical protein
LSSAERSVEEGAPEAVLSLVFEHDAGQEIVKQNELVIREPSVEPIGVSDEQLLPNESPANVPQIVLDFQSRYGGVEQVPVKPPFALTTSNFLSLDPQPKIEFVCESVLLC